MGKQQGDMPSATRVKLYGSFSVFSPYESCDGRGNWTVQKVEWDSDADDLGYIIAEFEQQGDAELFALVKSLAAGAQEAQ
jgi:hypothetical protein